MIPYQTTPRLQLPKLPYGMTRADYLEMAYYLAAAEWDRAAAEIDACPTAYDSECRMADRESTYAAAAARHAASPKWTPADADAAAYDATHGRDARAVTAAYLAARAEI